MNKEAWLQLSDYSNKYRVSVSTLRRRIKAGEIKHQFEEGKYWLPDSAIEKYARNRKAAAAATVVAEPKEEIIPLEPHSEEIAVHNDGTEFPVRTQMSSFETEQFITREEVLDITNSMMAELKSAYVLVLQEKESSIMECKKEIADLKTLCHTLESENERLKAETHAPLTGWFVDDDSEVEV